VFLLVAAATHAGSMFATSFVEEEHQTLYYTVSTLHLLQFVSALRTNPKAGVHALVLLTCARVLRSYNQVSRCFGFSRRPFFVFPFAISFVIIITLMYEPQFIILNGISPQMY
jgi:hypothetical protein